MRRVYLFMRVDDIVFEYQLNESRLSNKIRNSRETEENKNNSHVAELPMTVLNANLARIQCEAVYFFCFVHYCSIEFCQNCFCLRSEVPSRDLNGTWIIDHTESECAIFIL